MKNFLLSLFVCLPALAFAQNPSECTSAGSPPFGGCCFDCTCYTCAAVDVCLNNVGPLADPAGCQLGGCSNCGENEALVDACTHFSENYFIDPNETCVPIDGGLGFLIAGGLGMGVLGVRRRKELELEA